MVDKWMQSKVSVEIKCKCNLFIISVDFFCKQDIVMLEYTRRQDFVML